MSCYETFSWTPDDIKRLPYSEAVLLSIYFEELALKSAEDRDAMERQSRSSNSSGGDWETDDVLGNDPEEIDYYTAQKQGLL